MKQKELAQELGIGKSCLSVMLNGKRKPKRRQNNEKG